MKRTARWMICGILAAGLLAGCGSKNVPVDGTEAAITVDGEVIRMGEAAFYLRAQQAETQMMMESYGFTDGGSLWDQTLEDEDGKSVTYGQQMKDSIGDELTGFVLLKEHAADYDAEMPDALKDAAAETAKTVYESNAEVFDKIGSTEEDIREVLELSAYPSLMTDLITADVDTEVSDEEAAQCRVVYVRTRLKETDESGAQIDASEETKETYRANLEKLLKEIQEAGEVDEESIREMANAIDEENIMVGTTTYGKDDAFLPEEVLTAAATLQDGETFGEVIETSDGFYYLVHMVAVLDRDATDTKKSSIVSQRKQEAYDAQLQEWKDAAEITTSEAWDNLTVTDSDPWRAVYPEAAEDVETAEEAGEAEQTEE